MLFSKVQHQCQVILYYSLAFLMAFFTSSLLGSLLLCLMTNIVMLECISVYNVTRIMWRTCVGTYVKEVPDRVQISLSIPVTSWLSQLAARQLGWFRYGPL